jgi:hypothetical protein
LRKEDDEKDNGHRSIDGRVVVCVSLISPRLILLAHLYPSLLLLSPITAQAAPECPWRSWVSCWESSSTTTPSASRTCSRCRRCDERSFFFFFGRWARRSEKKKTSTSSSTTPLTSFFLKKKTLSVRHGRLGRGGRPGVPDEDAGHAAPGREARDGEFGFRKVLGSHFFLSSFFEKKAHFSSSFFDLSTSPFFSPPPPIFRSSAGTTPTRASVAGFRESTSARSSRSRPSTPVQSPSSSTRSSRCEGRSCSTPSG